MAIKVCLNQITPENFHHVEILADIIAIGYETEEAETGLVDQVQPDIPSLLLPLSMLLVPTLQTPTSRVLDAPLSLSYLLLLQQVSVRTLSHAVDLQRDLPCQCS